MERVLPRKSKKLLVQRNVAADMLSCHPRTLIRLEEAGKLEAVRLAKKGRVFYRAADIEALAERGLADKVPFFNGRRAA